MLVSPTTAEVRWIVEQSYQRFFGISEDDLEDMIELPMVEDGRCVARSYRVANLLAMWLKDVGILQFYDDQGRMLRRANLFAEMHEGEAVQQRAAAA